MNPKNNTNYWRLFSMWDLCVFIIWWLAINTHDLDLCAHLFTWWCDACPNDWVIRDDVGSKGYGMPCCDCGCSCGCDCDCGSWSQSVLAYKVKHQNTLCAARCHPTQCSITSHLVKHCKIIQKAKLEICSPFPFSLFHVCFFVGWLLNVPATCKCISGMHLLRQFYMLPHWNRSCRSNFLPHPVTVYWHQADQSQRWP